MSFFGPLTPRNNDWFHNSKVEAEKVAKSFESLVVEPEKKLTDVGETLWKPRSLMDDLDVWQKTYTAVWQAHSLQGFFTSPAKVTNVSTPWTALDEAEEPEPKFAVEEAKLQKLQAATPRKIEAPPQRQEQIPDLITPIVGWRGWKVRNNRLVGLGVKAIWPTKRPTIAECRIDRWYNDSTHEAPKESCNCGVWAFKSLEILNEAAADYRPDVIGTVSLWGRVIECENGWRAQFAYPKELWLLEDGLEKVGVEYGVPIRSL